MARLLLEYAGPEPTRPPLRYHWYEGAEPPDDGVGVNIVLVPAQIELPGVALIVTDGVVSGVKERLPKFVPATPVITPVTPVAEDAYIYPEEELVAVACTCNPVIVN